MLLLKIHVLKVPVISGVPHAGNSICIHFLLIFINDLPDIMKHSYFHLLADDCILYKQILFINDAQILQSDLDSLCLWADTWLMKFNTSQCHVMHITLAS